MLELKHAIESMNFASVEKLKDHFNIIIPPDPDDKPFDRKKTPLKVAFELFEKDKDTDYEMIRFLVEKKSLLHRCFKRRKTKTQLSFHISSRIYLKYIQILMNAFIKNGQEIKHLPKTNI